MKEEILTYLNEPRQLEKMYRTNKVLFKIEFSKIYPGLKGSNFADFWNERLNYESEEINWGTRQEIFFVVIASLVAGVIAKVPAFLPVSEEFFYIRNIGFIICVPLMAYFAWKNKLSTGKTAFIVGATFAGIIFINLLPDVKNNDTLILSCIHLLLFLWCILGFVHIGEIKNNDHKRLSFLKYNGDLVVITTLILIAGAILTGITIGLFSLIGFNIEKFYFENVAIFGLAAAPIIGTFLIRSNPQLVGKVSPVIAKIFSPLVLVMLVIYLGAMIYSGKDPYNDREFLIIFNGLLIGVMAIIFFSVADTTRSFNHTTSWILFLLTALTVIVNVIALSAIIFRISEWGITPNRAAVVGGNGLILINLILVAAQLIRVNLKQAEISGVGRIITSYLPIYFVWTIIVTFLFPLMFGFK